MGKMEDSGTKSFKMQRKVLLLSSVLFTVQLMGIIGTVVFYLMAASERFKSIITETVVTSLYSNSKWKLFKRSALLEVHILSALGVQLGLGLVSILLLIGICKRIRCLLLPWLIIFVLVQVILLMSVMGCVVYLPPDFKIIGLGVAAFECFVIFPWWYAIIHLYAAIKRKESREKTDNILYERTNTVCSCETGSSVQSLHDRSSVLSPLESCRSASRCGTLSQIGGRNFNTASRKNYKMALSQSSRWTNHSSNLGTIRSTKKADIRYTTSEEDLSQL